MQFNMTYSQVNQVVTQMEKYATIMKDHLDDVTLISGRVSGGNWQGRSADQYVVTFNELKPNFDVFYEDIMACIALIKTAMASYESQDEGTANMFIPQ